MLQLQSRRSANPDMKFMHVRDCFHANLESMTAASSAQEHHGRPVFQHVSGTGLPRQVMCAAFLDFLSFTLSQPSAFSKQIFSTSLPRLGDVELFTIRAEDLSFTSGTSGTARTG